MRTTWNFHSAGQIVFGRDAVRQLGRIAGGLNAHRVLIVTDATLVEAGVVQRATAPLVKAGIACELFTGGQPDPPISAVNEAVELAKRFGSRQSAQFVNGILDRLLAGHEKN